VRDLIQHGRATLIRPSRLTPDDYVEEGLPVWLPGDISAVWQRAEPPKFADPAKVDPRSITHPGDIVFTTVGELRTRVDDDGGHVLGRSLQALRLERDTFDPHAVAELLRSEPNRQLVTGTIPRVNVLELEIPRLDPSQTSHLRKILEATEHNEEKGHAIARSAAALRTAVIDAMATGAVTIEDASEETDG
jgi:hypothetical protein